MCSKWQGEKVERGQDPGKVPGTSTDVNLVHPQGLRLKYTGLGKARCMNRPELNSQVGKKRS